MKGGGEEREGGRVYFKISPVNSPFNFFLFLQSLYSKRNTIKEPVFKLDALSNLLPNKNHGFLLAETKSVRPSYYLSVPLQVFSAMTN